MDRFVCLAINRTLFNGGQSNQSRITGEFMITLTYYLFDVDTNDIQVVDNEEDSNVVYDFEASINLNAIKSYFIDNVGEYTFHKIWSHDKQYAFLRAIEMMYDEDMFSSERLESNKDFINFLKGYYLKDMIKEYEDSQEKEKERD